jgi:hypothetical protein
MKHLGKKAKKHLTYDPIDGINVKKKWQHLRRVQSVLYLYLKKK